MKYVTAFLCLLAFDLPVNAQNAVQSNPPATLKLAAKRAPAKKAAPAAAADADNISKANEAIRDLYAELPLQERIAIQSNLVWSGDYNGGVNGEFNDRAIAAAKAFQKRSKQKETGFLTPEERATLAAAVKVQQDQSGWKMVEDAALPGMRLGIPAKIAPKTGIGKTGSRWTSVHNEVQIETFRARPTELAAEFEQQKKNPSARRVEYSVLRPDFFVVSGLQGLKKFYVRAQIKDKEVRGLVIMYDQAMEGIMDPIAVMMSSAFAPFGSGAFPMPVAKRKVEYSTALFISKAGHLIADRQATESCETLVAAGHPAERIAEDKNADLALLQIHGQKSIAPIALASAPPANSDLTLVGISDPQVQNGGQAVTTAVARLGNVSGSAVTLEPSPALGFSGGAALDQQGHFVGVAVGKTIANNGNTQSVALIPSATIKKFLATKKIEAADGDISVEGAKAAAARVICVRK